MNFRCGHPKTKENSYVNGRGSGYLMCRTCVIARAKAYAKNARTEFACGHPITPENTIIDKSGLARRCKICRNAKRRLWLDRRGNAEAERSRCLLQEVWK